MSEDKLCETDQRPHGSNSPSQKPNVEINAKSLHHRLKHLKHTITSHLSNMQINRTFKVLYSPCNQPPHHNHNTTFNHPLAVFYAVCRLGQLSIFCSSNTPYIHWVPKLVTPLHQTYLTQLGE